MAEVEQSIPVCLGLSDIEIGANQGNEDGVEDVEDELLE